MPELIPAEPRSPEWLAVRRLGVTATDIVTILGLSSWDSAYSLFWRKMGQVPEIPDNDRFRLARELEPYVRARWTLSREDAIFGIKEGLFRSSVRPWQMATPDGVLYTDEAPSAVAVLELKTWADADRHAWDDGPPAGVRAQVLWQMDVIDVATGHVGVVFLPSGEFRSYVIEHDHHHGIMKPIDPPIYEYPDCASCTDLTLMRAAGEKFMTRLRLEMPPPDPDASAATLAAVRARFTPQPAKTAEIDAGLWQVYADTAESIRMQEGFKRSAEILLREQAGEAHVLCVDGQPVARRIVSDQKVKAHNRHMDYFSRIKQPGDSDE